MIRLNALSVVAAMTLLVAPRVHASTMTFDLVPSGTVVPYGGVYEEDGIRATSRSANSVIGDPMLMIPTSAVYFDGVSDVLEVEYIEFSMINGWLFDLSSLDLITNIRPDRLIATSANPAWIQLGPSGAFGAISSLLFSGPQYSNLEWFRVGTSHFATEVDNVVVQAVQPVPEPATVGLLCAGLIGLVGMKRKLR